MNDLGGIQPVHVWFSVLVASTAICTFLWRIARSLRHTNAIMEKFLIEHEVLIGDYCERKGIKPESLPTRLKGLMQR